MADIKYRVMRWIDTKNMRHHFGVQIKRPEDRRYLHCHRNGIPLIFPTRKQAKEAIAALQTGSP